jgi:hypothetical protein
MKTFAQYVNENTAADQKPCHACAESEPDYSRIGDDTGAAIQTFKFDDPGCRP